MRAVNLTIICVTLILTGVLFWPTLYRYAETQLDNSIYPVRISRITGDATFFIAGEWRHEARPVVVSDAVSSRLPHDEASKVTGRASYRIHFQDGSPSFGGTIYNGSEWHITAITFEVSVKEGTGSVLWDRKPLRHEMEVKPLSIEHFRISKTMGVDPPSLDSWRIIEVIGLPPAK